MSTSTRQYNKLPSPSLKTCFSRQVSGEEKLEVGRGELPLPDVVLCSSLSANILQQRKQRQRRRHNATIQSPTKMMVPDVDPDELMEPLIRSMEIISMDPAVEDTEMQVETESSQPESPKRRRTNSASEAAVLSTISSSMSPSREKKNVENKDDSLVSTIKNMISNIFSH